MTVTMEPVLRHGMSGWDQTLVPIDEYDMRVMAFRDLLERHQAQAAIIASDPFEPGSVSYLNGYVPTTKWSLLLVALDGRQLLVAGLGGGRDHPHIRAVSAARDIAFFRRPAIGLLDTLQGWDIGPGGLATIGFDRHLPWAEADDIERAHREAGWEIRSLDGPYANLRRAKRPRELRLMATGRRRLLSAVAEAQRTLVETGDTGAALARLEALARVAGAHDVRIMTDDGEGFLQPYRGGHHATEADSWYVAAEYLGYWSEVAVTRPQGSSGRDQELNERIRAVSRELQPAALLSDVAARHESPDGATGAELRRIGSSLDEWTDDDSLVAGEVVAVLAWARAGKKLAVAGEQLVVSPAGGRILDQAVD